MTDALLHRLAALSDRERGLLAVLGLIVLPLAVVLGVVLLLLEAREAALTRVREARALHAWVEEQVAALPPGALAAAGGAEDAAEGPIGISGVERSLVAAGLREHIDRLANRRGGGIEIVFGQVRFDALVEWLDEAARGWGYTITSLRMERGEIPGHVTADLVLDAAR